MPSTSLSGPSNPLPAGRPPTSPCAAFSPPMMASMSPTFLASITRQVHRAFRRTATDTDVEIHFHSPRLRAQTPTPSESSSLTSLLRTYGVGEIHVMQCANIDIEEIGGEGHRVALDFVKRLLKDVKEDARVLWRRGEWEGRRGWTDGRENKQLWRGFMQEEEMEEDGEELDSDYDTDYEKNDVGEGVWVGVWEDDEEDDEGYFAECEDSEGSEESEGEDEDVA